MNAMPVWRKGGHGERWLLSTPDGRWGISESCTQEGKCLCACIRPHAGALPHKAPAGWRAESRGGGSSDMPPAPGGVTVVAALRPKTRTAEGLLCSDVEPDDRVRIVPLSGAPQGAAYAATVLRREAGGVVVKWAQPEDGGPPNRSGHEEMIPAAWWDGGGRARAATDDTTVSRVLAMTADAATLAEKIEQVTRRFWGLAEGSRREWGDGSWEEQQHAQRQQQRGLGSRHDTAEFRGRVKEEMAAGVALRNAAQERAAQLRALLPSLPAFAADSPQVSPTAASPASSLRSPKGAGGRGLRGARVEADKIIGAVHRASKGFDDVAAVYAATSDRLTAADVVARSSGEIAWGRSMWGAAHMELDRTRAGSKCATETWARVREYCLDHGLPETSNQENFLYAVCDAFRDAAAEGTVERSTLAAAIARGKRAWRGMVHDRGCREVCIYIGVELLPNTERLLAADVDAMIDQRSGSEERHQ